MSLAEKDKKVLKYFTYEEAFFWGSFFCLFFSMIYTSRNVLFATHDDILNFIAHYRVGFTEVISTAMESQILRMRFDPINILSITLHWLVSNTNSIFVFKLYLYVPIFICILSIYLFLNKRVGKQYGSLFGIFFLLFVSLDSGHNIMIAYPFNFMINITTFVIILELLYRYYENKKMRYIIIGAVMFFFLCMAYESFIVFSFVIFVIVLSKNIQKEEDKTKIDWKSILKELSPYIIGTVIYIVMYLYVRMTHTFTYAGTSVSEDLNIKLIVKAMLFYFFGNFPLSNFFRNHVYNLVKIENLTAAMVFKAFIGTAIVALLCKNIQKISWKKSLIIMGTSFVTGFVFILPYALTPQYQLWASAKVLYVPSMFSYFWIIIILVVATGLLVNIKKIRKPMIALLLVGVFVTSILSDYSNQYTLKQPEDLSRKEIQFSRMVQTDYYKELPEDSIIFTEDFIGVHYDLNSFSIYTENALGIDVKYTSNLDDLKEYQNKYVLHYNADTSLIWIGKLGEDYGSMSGEEVFAVPFEDDKAGTYLLQKNNGLDEVIVNGQYYDEFPEYAWISVSLSEPTLIQTEGINYNNFGFAYETVLNNSVAP